MAKGGMPCPITSSSPDGAASSARVDREIVDFAMSEIQRGDDGKCPRDVEVKNFKSQVGFNKYLQTMITMIIITLPIGRDWIRAHDCAQV